MAEPVVNQFANTDELNREAARMIAELATSRISEAGEFTIALSGGSTPRALYALLGDEYKDKIQWTKVHIFWGDERAVGPDDEASNYKMANEAMLGKLNLTESKNIHRIKGELGAVDAAADYDREIREHFGEGGLPRFDLIHLGLGTDGHTASLFPGTAALLEGRAYATPVTESEVQRITLTYPIINNARTVMFIATGKAKATPVLEILVGGNAKKFPAGRIRPRNGNLIWMLDADAASEITDAASDLV